MASFEVTEYDHFVSFVYHKDDGNMIVVQYRNGQVWKDEAGVWQVKDGQAPSYSFASKRKTDAVVLSPTILKAFAEVSIEGDG